MKLEYKRERKANMAIMSLEKKWVSIQHSEMLQKNHSQDYQLKVVYYAVCFLSEQRLLRYQNAGINEKSSR